MNIKKSIQSTTIFQKYNDWRWREREVCYGDEYADRTFYVIRRHASRAGLFSFVMTNLGSIQYAVEQGWIPVIDMQTSINPMITLEEVGEVNAWDLYFEQPADIKLDEIKNAKSVVLSRITPPDNYPDHLMFRKNSSVNCWRDLCRAYVRPTVSITNEVNQYIETEFSGHRVLGVLCRGTDYLNLKPKGHPIQPDSETVIRETAKIMGEYGYDVIYLATEDEFIWDRFQDRFPGRVISYQRNHYTVTSGEMINDVANAKIGTREANREYLISILVLSKCKGLLAGIAGGTYGALLFSDGFEFEKIYDLGLYD